MFLNLQTFCLCPGLCENIFNAVSRVLDPTVYFKKDGPTSTTEVFGSGVQCACQQSVDMADGKVVQHIVKMCREAKALHSSPNWPTSWVHLDY